MRLTLYIFILFLVPATAKAECRNYRPATPDCHFYQGCLEKKYHCGEEGYPVGYGGKYCSRFISLNTHRPFNGNELSEEGVKWRDRTLVCLQDELIRVELQSGFRSCEDIKDIGFNTHAACYAKAEPSICDLPLSDWMSIAGVVDIKDYGQTRSVKQVLEVMVTCSERVWDDLTQAEGELDFVVSLSAPQPVLALSFHSNSQQSPEVLHLENRVSELKGKMRMIRKIKEMR